MTPPSPPAPRCECGHAILLHGPGCRTCRCDCYRSVTGQLEQRQRQAAAA